MFEADREHLHHLLLERGVPVYAAAWIMMGAAALCGAAGLAAWRLGVPDWMMSYAFIALFVVVLVSAYYRERAIAREADAGAPADALPGDQLKRARELRGNRIDDDA
jgi:UDP-GlcNAc:undecaprenyl-phosphate GlcNAc-1-phosphate transferase